MSRKSFFDSRFWNDPWVTDKLTIEQRYLFFYLVTNSYSNIAGVYEISLRTMSNETGLDRDGIIEMLQSMSPRVRYVDGWIVLQNSIKNQNYHSPKAKKHIDNRLKECPGQLIQYIKWPDDYGTPRPEPNEQPQLVLLEGQDFDDGNGRQIRHRLRQSSKKLLSVPTTPPLSVPTTPSSVKYGMDTVSYTNTNTNTNKTTVTTTLGDAGFAVPNPPKTSPPATTGKNFQDRKYQEVNALYAELWPLVNQEYREWYFSVFFRLGRDRVLVLASQAKADTNSDPKKLFSTLLKREAGSLPVRDGATATVGDVLTAKRLGG